MRTAFLCFPVKVVQRLGINREIPSKTVKRNHGNRIFMLICYLTKVKMCAIISPFTERMCEGGYDRKAVAACGAAAAEAA